MSWFIWLKYNFSTLFFLRNLNDALITTKRLNLSSYKKQTTIQEYEIKPSKNFIFQLHFNFSGNIEVQNNNHQTLPLK